MKLSKHMQWLILAATVSTLTVACSKSKNKRTVPTNGAPKAAAPHNGGKAQKQEDQSVNNNDHTKVNPESSLNQPDYQKWEPKEVISIVGTEYPVDGKIFHQRVEPVQNNEPIVHSDPELQVHEQLLFNKNNMSSQGIATGYKLSGQDTLRKTEVLGEYVDLVNDGIMTSLKKDLNKLNTRLKGPSSDWAKTFTDININLNLHNKDMYPQLSPLEMRASVSFYDYEANGAEKHIKFNGFTHGLAKNNKITSITDDGKYGMEISCMDRSAETCRTTRVTILDFCDPADPNLPCRTAFAVHRVGDVQVHIEKSHLQEAKQSDNADYKKFVSLVENTIYKNIGHNQLYANRMGVRSWAVAGGTAQFGVVMETTRDGKYVSGHTSVQGPLLIPVNSDEPVILRADRATLFSNFHSKRQYGVEKESFRSAFKEVMSYGSDQDGNIKLGFKFHECPEVCSSSLADISLDFGNRMPEASAHVPQRITLYNYAAPQNPRQQAPRTGGVKPPKQNPRQQVPRTGGVKPPKQNAKQQNPVQAPKKDLPSVMHTHPTHNKEHIHPGGATVHGHKHLGIAKGPVAIKGIVETKDEIIDCGPHMHWSSGEGETAKGACVYSAEK